MIFDPEYVGVCSWRMLPPPYVKSSDWPSGDHDTPPMGLSSARVTSDSLPSASDRVQSSAPPDAAPRPRPPRPACGGCAGCPIGLTNATRDPSGDGVMPFS